MRYRPSTVQFSNEKLNSFEFSKLATTRTLLEGATCALMLAGSRNLFQQPLGLLYAEVG